MRNHPRTDFRKRTAGPFLGVEGLGVVFGGTTVFAGVSFECMPGGIAGIVGPNGCGKTTLLNVISGFLRPAAGVVAYYGEELSPVSPLGVARAGLGVARSFQTAFAVGGMSVLDNVVVGRRHTGEGVSGLIRSAMGRDEGESSLRRQARLLLEALGLASAEGMLCGRLSTGQRRRVDIARAIFSGAQLLLLDEPFANLDAETAVTVAQLLRSLAEKGRSIVIVEHRGEILGSISDQTVRFTEGGPPLVEQCRGPSPSLRLSC